MTMPESDIVVAIQPLSAGKDTVVCSPCTGGPIVYVQKFSDGELAEIYRRGRRTVNRITGYPLDSGLTYRPSGIQHDLEWYKKKKPDNELFMDLALYPFFGGMKAVIVEKYRYRIYSWFCDYHEAAEFGDKEVAEMKADKRMFHNEKKIKAAIYNAGEFRRVVEEYGSFIEYIFSFDPHESIENLDALITDFVKRFKQYGTVNADLYLKDVNIGLPLIKPDLVMTRTFFRIGLVDRDKDEEGTMDAAREMARAAGVPVSWVDSFISLGLKDFFCPGSEVCGTKTDCELDEDACEIKEYCEQWVKYRDTG